MLSIPEICFNNLRYALLVMLLLCASACEKEVDIDLSSGKTKLVVEGFIETGQPPVVLLTRSIGFLAHIDLGTLENSFAHGAVVSVSDGQRTIQLKEYSLDTGINLNKFFLYTIDTADMAAFTFRGQTEKMYKLSIDFEGRHYEASTKIPQVRGIDSLWFRKADKPTTEMAVRMYIKFKDPDTLGNYIRYFTQRNNALFYTGPQSVYDDAVVNGTTIDSLTVFAGFSRAREPNLDSVGVFYRGDTVTLRWCAIDRDVYEFYNTFEYATGTVGNPFASPVNVRTNIKGGALGVWAGYGAMYFTSIVP
jgi:hypothetical protein